MTTRVLVVDDHEPWRHFVSVVLRETLQYEVVGEAADGLEAVQAAATHKPHLILLDISLPNLSGIEAARRILALTPAAKILFVSDHRSSDVAEAALGTGALGYLVKSDAGFELLPAIEAVTAGKPFLSARLARDVFAETPAERAPERTRHHEAEFYSDEATLLNGFARFAERTLEAGSALIAVVTSAHRNPLTERLRASGVDLDLAIAEGRFVLLDVTETLSTFMVDGWPDEARFWEATTPLIDQAARSSSGTPRPVAACGEIAPSLWRDGHRAAAVRLERLWDELAIVRHVDTFCGYWLATPRHDDEYFRQVCAAHSVVRSR